MDYPNLPNSHLEITSQPEVKEITNELLKQLQSALNSNTLFTEQVELSLKGIVRILEVLLSLDFFKNANEIDSSLRNSIEWLSNAGESLKAKMKEYEGFFNDFNTSMRANEQEVTATLNANTENIKSEIKKLENQIIETATRLLTSYQIFLNNAKESANNEITTNKTQATTEINEAKKTAFNELLETLKPKFSGLFSGIYYINNVIYINGGWEQKVKDLSDYTLEKSKKGE
ncbi:ATPase [Helicobacter pylori]|nr:ATPase [Helicobacter pylori]